LNAFSDTLKVVLDSIASIENQELNPATAEHFAKQIPKASDADRVFTFVNELKQLLEEDDYQAAKSLKALKTALPYGIAGDELADLEDLIEGYEFEKALQMLSDIERNLIDKLEGSAMLE